MKMRFYSIVTLFIVILLFNANLSAQNRDKDNDSDKLIKVKPKLVVGIVVDQMRYDYLTRFYNHFGNDGFKRLVEEGFNCKNNHFNYSPTSTGPGHTSVYSGATPSIHGIIGNNWYDKELDADVYCASDDSYTSVGTTSNAGQMSPHRMTVTTITDELRLNNQMLGKTIAIALKDRGAVLPGGHTANAAYWFHGANEGKWITSSYYMEQLPKWVIDFNSSGKAQSYKKAWNTIKDIKDYRESGADNNAYEGLFEGETSPIFPHSTTALLNKTENFDIIKATPFGNSLTTDYVGHMYGVNSKEVQDTYIRLDEDLARLFKALDKNVGEGEYTVFLTADHGAIEVPAYLKDKKIPAGYIDNAANSKKLSEFLKYTYGTVDILKNYSNYQLFLDHKIIKNLNLDLTDVQTEIAQEFLGYDAIDRVYTASQMWNNQYTSGIPYILQNGFNQKQSGDILVVLKPGFISYSKTGSTHGSPQIYDTHTPLLFYGMGIKPGSTVNRTEIPDIAPTIAVLLGISFPSGANGTPITVVLE